MSLFWSFQPRKGSSSLVFRKKGRQRSTLCWLKLWEWSSWSQWWPRWGLWNGNKNDSTTLRSKWLLSSKTTAGSITSLSSPSSPSRQPTFINLLKTVGTRVLACWITSIISNCQRGNLWDPCVSQSSTSSEISGTSTSTARSNLALLSKTRQWLSCPRDCRWSSVRFTMPRTRDCPLPLQGITSRWELKTLMIMMSVGEIWSAAISTTARSHLSSGLKSPFCSYQRKRN